MKFGEDNFVCGFDSGARLNMQCEDSVSTRRILVQVVLADRPLHLSLEETVQCFLLCVANLLGQALDRDSTALVICYLQVLLASDGASRFIGQ